MLWFNFDIYHISIWIISFWFNNHWTNRLSSKDILLLFDEAITSLPYSAFYAFSPLYIEFIKIEARICSINKLKGWVVYKYKFSDSQCSFHILFNFIFAFICYLIITKSEPGHADEILTQCIVSNWIEVSLSAMVCIVLILLKS